MSSIVNDTKPIGEIPSGLILGVTENMSITDAIIMLVFLLFAGIALFFLKKGSRAMKQTKRR